MKHLKRIFESQDSEKEEHTDFLKKIDAQLEEIDKGEPAPKYWVARMVRNSAGKPGKYSWQHNSSFTPCWTKEEVKDHVKKLLNMGVSEMDIRVFSAAEKAKYQN